MLLTRKSLIGEFLVSNMRSLQITFDCKVSPIVRIIKKAKIAKMMQIILKLGS